MATEDDSDVPETGGVFTYGKSKFADNVPSKFWIRNDRVVIVACGDEHTALVAESGRIFTFGSNDWGQLGLGNTKSATKPSCIKSLKGEKVKSVVCGRSHTIVATDDNKLFAFGANSEGQLGIEGLQGSLNPTRIDSFPDTPIKSLSAGTDHTAVLTENGDVYVWGGGSEGQLGLGDLDECAKPVKIPFNKKVTCVSCGYYHTALVTNEGKLYTFGESDNGKLGLGEDIEEHDTPQLVKGIEDRVVWVACGGSHTVAVTGTGKVYTFGEGSNGQLGHGTSVLQCSEPRLVTKLKSVKIKTASCGENHTALISEKGNLFTFGDGRHGKLAQGEENFSNVFQPSKVTRFAKFIVDQVSCGGCHMLVIAHKRLENGDVNDSGDEIEEPLKRSQNNFLHAKDDIDLSSSISARDRRRLKDGPLTSLNRTLPTLSTTRALPPLNSSLPAKVQDPLAKGKLPGIPKEDVKSTVSKSKVRASLDDEEDEDEDEEEDSEVSVTPEGESDEETEDENEEFNKTMKNRKDMKAKSADIKARAEQKKKLEEQQKKKGKSKKDVEEDEDEDEDEDEEHEEKHKKKKTDERKKKDDKEVKKKKKKTEDEDEEDEDEDDEEEDEEEEDTKKKKDKHGKDKKKEKETKGKEKKKESKFSFFGKKKVLDDEEEDEDDEEDEEDEEEEKENKKEKDKKSKTKEKNDKSKNKDSKEKDKKKKSKSKDEEEDDEEDEDDEEEEKDTNKSKDKDKKRKDKKKGKDDEEEEEDEEDEEEEKGKNKKKSEKDKAKNKKKDKEDDEDEEEDEEEENEEEEKKGKKKDDKKEEERKEEPPKKSRTCSIL